MVYHSFVLHSPKVFLLRKTLIRHSPNPVDFYSTFGSAFVRIRTILYMAKSIQMLENFSNAATERMACDNFKYEYVAKLNSNTLLCNMPSLRALGACF